MSQTIDISSMVSTLSPIVIFGIVQRFFYWWHDAEPEYGRDVSDYLLGRKSAPSWKSLGIGLLNRVYTVQHWSLRCLYRSAVVSVITWFLMMNLIWQLQTGHSFLDQMKFELASSNGIFTFSGLIITNIIIDYLSLAETRYIMNRASQSALPLMLWLVIDLAFSVLLVMTGMSLFLLMEAILYSPSLFSSIGELLTSLMKNSLNNMLELGRLLIFGASEDHTGTVATTATLFFTTMLTSIWLYIHAIAITAAKFSLTYPRVTKLLGTNPEKVEKEPLKFLGTYLALTAALAWIAIQVLAYFTIGKVPA